jgi:hypothetical protein
MVAATTTIWAVGLVSAARREVVANLVHSFTGVLALPEQVSSFRGAGAEPHFPAVLASSMRRCRKKKERNKSTDGILNCKSWHGPL